MKLWTCTDHDTAWPVGGASIVIAETETKARLLLDAALADESLDSTKPYTLIEIDLTKAQAIVLNNGEY